MKSKKNCARKNNRKNIDIMKLDLLNSYFYVILILGVMWHADFLSLVELRFETFI